MEKSTGGTPEEYESASKHTGPIFDLDFRKEKGLETMLQNDNIDQKMVDDTALMQKTLDFLVKNAKITVSTEENNAALNTEAAEDEAE